MTLTNRFSTAKSSVKALITLCIILVFFILMAIGISLLSSIPHIQMVALFKIVAAIQTFFLFVAPSVIVAYLFSRKPWRYLHINKAPGTVAVLLIFLSQIAAIPFMNLVIEWNQSMHLPAFMSGIESWMRSSEEAAMQVTEQLLTTGSIGGLIINLLIIGVLAGIGEEFLFRGVFQRLFYEKSRNKHFAIWAVAILFSAIHLQFYGFIPRMLLGAFFGYLLVWSGNLWLPILAHTFNNSVAVIWAYLATKNPELEKTTIDTIGTAGSETWWTAWCSLLLFGSIVWILYRYVLRKN